MMGFNRGVGLAVAVLALGLPLGLARQAGAQENLDSGKTGAQLFASDCAICHKSVASLNKSNQLFGLANFLREHYTASSQSASIIAAYVESIARPQAPGRRSGAAKRTAKGDDKAKSAEKKPGSAKSGEAKSGKPAESKSSESSTSGAKTSPPRPPEAIPSQPKADAKPDKPAKTN